MKLKLGPILRTCVNSKLLRSKNFNENAFRKNYSFEEVIKSTQPVLKTDESSIKQKLNEFSVPFTDGYTCIHIPGCGLCSQSTKKTKSDKIGIYINKKTGFFLCSKCKCSGDWSVFNNFINKAKSQSPKVEVNLIEEDVTKYEEPLNMWKGVLNVSIPLLNLDDATYKNIFKKFKLTPCSKQTIEGLQIMISKDYQSLYLPMFSYGSTIVGYKTMDTNGNVNTYPSCDCPGFLMSNTPSSPEAVITAKVPDYFALLSLNIPKSIICLPYGTSNLPQNTLPFLENFNKITLWLGGSLAWDNTMSFSKKLNEKRCYLVNPINKQSSVVTALSRGENVLQIINNAKPTWHESIISFNALREEILAELQNKNDCVGISWKRFPKLNSILKGHRRGELTVLTGPTGSGKTTFISEYSLDLALQGVNTLWGSFEIKNTRLAKRMLQQYAYLPLEENLEQFDFWADKFEQLPIFFMTFHGQQPLSAVMDAVEHSSYVHDIAHVIIDNVQFMIDISPESVGIDRFWKQDILIQAFRSFASKFNCHVTLVMHPKKGMDGMDLSVNSIFGGAKAAQEADNILIIQNQSHNSLSTRKVLQICKNRFSGDLGTMPLNFNKSSFGFSQPSNNKDAEESIEDANENADKEKNFSLFKDEAEHFEFGDMDTFEKNRTSQIDWKKNRKVGNHLMRIY